VKKIIFTVIVLLFFAGCEKEEKISPSNLPPSNKMSLDEFYDKYCYGYKVADTTNLSVLGKNVIDEKIYLSGIRNKKLWIGKFDVNTKEQLFEFLDSEELPNKKHLGFGEYEDFHIDKSDITKYIEGEDFNIIKVNVFDSEKNPYYNPLSSGSRWKTSLLIFDNDKSGKRYEYIEFDRVNLMEWYDNSYLENIDITKKEESSLTTCFNQYGDTILTGRANFLSEDVFPISFTHFILYEIKGHLEHGNLLPYLTLELDSIALPTPTNPRWRTYLCAVEDWDSKITSVNIVNKQGDMWRFKFEILNRSGSRQSYEVNININTGEIQ
jgi:hypothetical protein